MTRSLAALLLVSSDLKSSWPLLFDGNKERKGDLIEGHHLPACGLLALAPALALELTLATGKCQVAGSGSYPHGAEYTTRAQLHPQTQKWSPTSNATAEHPSRRRKYKPPKGDKLRKELRHGQKTIAGRYYQRLTGHAAAGGYLCNNLASDKCWWCNSGEKQSRYHLCVQCEAWKRQINLCEWRHHRAAR